ncbi:two-component system sensor histidine kinase DctS [Kroppenstedtia sanguinis]
MRMFPFPIHWKITALIFFIVGFSLVIGGIFLLGNYTKTKEDELKKRSAITARTVAELPEIRKGVVGNKEAQKRVNFVAEKVRVINEADYIVVMNMDRVRLAHPLEDRIGTVSKGADEGPAFAEHTYTTQATGEIGTVIRAFVPIMNQEHQQIGVVIAGYRLPGITEILFSVYPEIFWTASLSLFFGGWGSWLLARHIKRQMFYLEPHEIANTLVKQTETFNAMHEGVIAIDNDERILIFNNKAKQMMGVSGDLIGKKIYEVVPDTRMPEILTLDQPVYNKELHVRNLDILSNRIPIKVDDRTVGVVAIFQDRTEVKKLAEELTGVKAFVSALRVQNHEHMNKLHTIAGLIQLGNSEKALNYVFEITEEQEELTRFLSKNIKDDSIAGLLLSKVSRGRELGIHVFIDRRSRLQSFPEYLDSHNFVVLLGNLVENAFESFPQVSIGEKEVYISIGQKEEALQIVVEDNGSGIPKELQDRIFTQGFSTKGSEGRGIGLHLVGQIVQQGHGKIQVESEPGAGTCITVTFEKQEEGD